MSIQPAKSKSTKDCDEQKMEEKEKEVTPLTLSKLKKILQSASYRANRNILRYNDFIKETENVLSALSVDERRNFLNNHLDETKLNKWDEKIKIYGYNNVHFNIVHYQYHFIISHMLIHQLKHQKYGLILLIYY